MRNILCSLQRYTKLQQDQEVDMFTIVRQLQSRRPEMISSMLIHVTKHVDIHVEIHGFSIKFVHALVNYFFFLTFAIMVCFILS